MATSWHDAGGKASVSFESRNRENRWLSYRLEPDAHVLDDGATNQLRTQVMAQVRLSPPRRPARDSQRGTLRRDLAADKFESRY